MKMLLLLTNSFPYGSGEDFLAAELERTRGFDRVIVCPCGRKPGDVRTKQIPAGVQCLPVEREALGKLSYAGLWFRPCVQAELFRLLGKGRFSLACVHELLYFMKNADEIFYALDYAVPVKAGDSVVVYSYWLYDAAAAGVRLAERLRKRGAAVTQVSRAHGFDIHSERSAHGYLPMRAYLFRKLDRIFPCSDDGAAVLRREAGRYSGKIKRSYLGTEDGGAAPQEREPFHIVSCSYMVPVKRLHLLAGALKEADFPVVWTHIGSGSLEGEIRALAEKLPRNVTAEFPGQMKNREVLEYYRTHPVSAFVNVSSSEGIPVTVMEAASFGIPVVATDVGGTHEIVADGFNGFLLPGGFAPEELLNALRKLRSMGGNEYAAFRENARRVWEEKFSAEKNYRDFYAALSAGTEESR